jgi:hypothetical protein
VIGRLPCETEEVISTILAHQGGWDEALMVLVPIGLFIGVLSVANRRAKKLQAERDGNPADKSGSGAVTEAGTRSEAETGTGD